MKAEYEYSAEEVEAIVLSVHTIKHPPPEGMAWRVRLRRYGDGTLKIEAGEKEPEGGAG